jgi:hypothetical protein
VNKLLKRYTHEFSPPRITVENSNQCTKCNDKSLALKLLQSYKMYWENKRGRTKEERTTFLQELNLGTPSQRGIFIGRIIYLDLLSIFRQIGARIMEGLRRKEYLKRSTLVEREVGKQS